MRYQKEMRLWTLRASGLGEGGLLGQSTSASEWALHH